MRRDSILVALGLCSLSSLACGDGGGGSNNGDLSFEGMCDQSSSLMCEKVSRCGSAQPQSDCIAESKALFCASGQEQFCGVGLTVQPNRAAACLDALKTLACSQLSERPAACTAEVLCSSSSPSDTSTPQGEPCEVLESQFECNPKATLCYAAGTSSSCPSKGLCLGDSKGMYCAARCTVDKDCLSAGTGLVCLQNCATLILNGFCMKPKAKAKFVEFECGDSAHATTPGTAGWAL